MKRQRQYRVVLPSFCEFIHSLLARGANFDDIIQELWNGVENAMSSTQQEEQRLPFVINNAHITPIPSKLFSIYLLYLAKCRHHSSAKATSLKIC